MNERIKSINSWVEYIKSNEDWKKHHTKFINAQYEKAYQAIKKMKSLRQGENLILEIYKIKNKKGYPKLLKN